MGMCRGAALVGGDIAATDAEGAREAANGGGEGGREEAVKGDLELSPC